MNSILSMSAISEETVTVHETDFITADETFIDWVEDHVNELVNYYLDRYSETINELLKKVLFHLRSAYMNGYLSLQEYADLIMEIKYAPFYASSRIEQLLNEMYHDYYQKF